MRVAVRDSLSISSVVRSSKVAIWSINAPVPPAQVPFIRSSAPPSKKMTFASSPPSSITTLVSGSSALTVSPVAKTSCTNGSPAASASPKPAEPEIATLTGLLPIKSLIRAKISSVLVRTCEK